MSRLFLNNKQLEFHEILEEASVLRGDMSIFGMTDKHTFRSRSCYKGLYMKLVLKGIHNLSVFLFTERAIDQHMLLGASLISSDFVWVFLA